MGDRDEERIERVVREAKDLVKILESTSVRRVLLETGEFKIEIERAFAKGGSAAAPAMSVSAGASPAAGGPAAKDDKLHRVVAPLLGTFYHAANPGAKAFVEVGSRVQKGQPIGIIETMKLMNQVLSDASGVVVEILVPNGQPVEFEQPLIVIDTAA